MYQRLRYSSIPFTDAHDFRKFPGTTLWNKFFSSSPLFTMNAQRIREEPLEKTRILPYSDDIVNFQFYWHVVGIRTYIYKYTSTLITRSNDDDREIIARISHGSPCTTCSVSKTRMKREREREREKRERGRKEERKKKKTTHRPRVVKRMTKCILGTRQFRDAEVLHCVTHRGVELYGGCSRSGILVTCSTDPS